KVKKNMPWFPITINGKNLGPNFNSEQQSGRTQRSQNRFFFHKWGGNMVNSPLDLLGETRNLRMKTHYQNKQKGGNTPKWAPVKKGGKNKPFSRQKQYFIKGGGKKKLIFFYPLE
ncbi:hypothetical protein, partial [Caldanaerobacter subterraneus]|uniref:hypothetical protein n=1 Tax=Caldanaerobacter subterraneus TaxID=911092 RepID=UPI001B80261A